MVEFNWRASLRYVRQKSRDYFSPPLFICLIIFICTPTQQTNALRTRTLSAEDRARPLFLLLFVYILVFRTFNSVAPSERKLIIFARFAFLKASPFRSLPVHKNNRNHCECRRSFRNWDFVQNCGKFRSCAGNYRGMKFFKMKFSNKLHYIKKIII